MKCRIEEKNSLFTCVKILEHLNRHYFVRKILSKIAVIVFIS